LNSRKVPIQKNYNAKNKEEKRRRKEENSPWLKALKTII